MRSFTLILLQFENLLQDLRIHKLVHSNANFEVNREKNCQFYFEVHIVLQVFRLSTAMQTQFTCSYSVTRTQNSSKNAQTLRASLIILVELTIIIICNKLLLDIQLYHSFMPDMFLWSWMVSERYVPLCEWKVKKLRGKLDRRYSDPKARNG